MDTRVGVDCDRILQDQLVIQKNVTDQPRMDFLILQVQSQRDECRAELWIPAVKADDGYPDGCLGVDQTVGGVAVPRGLTYKGGAPVPGGGGLVGVVATTYRDAKNNILVFWKHPDDTSSGGVDGLPADGAVCWLYVADFDAWVSGYRTR